MNDEIKFSEAFKVAIAGPDIVNILEGLAADADADLSTAVSIESTRVFPSVADLPLEKNQDGKYIWKEITDVSVVATDLKSSTAVSYGKQDRVGARLYQASTGNCAKVLQPFGPDFVDIQGDGLFAIFAGDKHNAGDLRRDLPEHLRAPSAQDACRTVRRGRARNEGLRPAHWC